MSLFDWNLSSEEEDEVDGLWAAASSKTTGVSSGVIGDARGGDNNDGNDDDDLHRSNLETSFRQSSAPEEVEEEPSAKGDADAVAVITKSNAVTPSSQHGYAQKRARYDDDECEEDSDDSEDDDDDVDWEDADDDEEEIEYAGEDDGDEDAKKPAAARAASSRIDGLPLRPVTVDMDGRGVADSSKEEDARVEKSGEKKIKRRRRKRFRVESLPENMKSLSWDLHRAHLLSLTAFAAHVSQTCSDRAAQSVAHSLLPRKWMMRSSSIESSESESESDERRTGLAAAAASAATKKKDGNHNSKRKNHKHENSSGKKKPPSPPQPPAPSVTQLREFTDWFFHLIHGTEERRRVRMEENAAAGAPSRRRRIRRRSTSGSSRRTQTGSPSNSAAGAAAAIMSSSSSSTERLIQYCSYLSPVHDEDPQLFLQQQQQHQQDSIAAGAGAAAAAGGRGCGPGAVVMTSWSALDRVRLLIAVARSMRWRVRYVFGANPVGPDLDENHPVLSATGDAFKAAAAICINGDAKPKASTRSSSSRRNKKRSQRQEDEELLAAAAEAAGGGGNDAGGERGGLPVSGWVEILCRDASTKSQRRWVHVDPVNLLVDRPDQVEPLLFSDISCLYSTKTATPTTSGPAKKKKRRITAAATTRRKKKEPIAYAIAVEHADCCGGGGSYYDDDPRTLLVRWTDVTPRYAHSWVASLGRRGTARGKRSLTDGTVEKTMNDSWWSNTLKTLNSDYYYGSSSSRRRKVSAKAKATAKAATAAAAAGRCQEEAIVVDGSDDGGGGDAAVDDSNNNDIDKKPPAAAVKECTTTTSAGTNTIAAPDDDGEESSSSSLVDRAESEELMARAAKDAIPSSKAAFARHPLYVIPSVLGAAEVLAPDSAQRVCGAFKGELVYRRSDVSAARTERKWPYHGRTVLPEQRNRPAKRVKARKKPASANGKFRPLTTFGAKAAAATSEANGKHEFEEEEQEDDDDDGMERLYGIWQTAPWSPDRVRPADAIPVNDHGNVELALLNPGLAHVDRTGAAPAAKKLGIPYAPCLVGFEGRAGNRTPRIRGVVVHEHNERLLREAHAAVSNHAAERRERHRVDAVRRRWKKLLAGLLIKDRLEREYGGDDREEES